MREITARGQTVDEAVQSALEQLNTTKDQVEVNVIDEGSKGFFGVFGTKPAIVSVVTIKNPIEETEEFIKDITRKMDVTIDLKTKVILL